MIFHDVLKRNPAFFLDVIGIFFYSQSDSGGGRGGAERIFLTGARTIHEMGINRGSVIINGAAVVCGSANNCSVGIVCSAAFVTWRGIRPWRGICPVTVSGIHRNVSVGCLAPRNTVFPLISAQIKSKNGIACLTF